MITRRRFLKYAGSVFLSAGALLSFASGAEALGTPRLQRYSFKPPRWTNGLKLKIAVVADIHACSPWMDIARIKTICDQTNALEADIIVLAGDYVRAIKHASEPIPDNDIANAVAGLKAPLGVHAVLGNHDYWQSRLFEQDPDLLPPVARSLQAAGISVYKNNAIRIEKDGKPFWLAGLGDQLALAHSPLKGPSNDMGLDDLPETLASVTDDAPIILVAHEPDIFPQVPDRVSLTICGHTHGGQVNILGWSPVIPSRFGTRYRGGHIVENGRHIVVSRGLGCTGAPVRLGVWPEIVLLDIG